jgi:tetratricopeptide (TPR) repeat protein
MEKKNLVILIATALWFCSYGVYGQSYEAQVKAALNAKNMAKAEELLKAWDLADANDAELYVSYFNFYTLKSLEKDSTRLEHEYALKALACITEGIERFPTRFDFRLGKIYMLWRLKDYEPFTAEVVRLIQQSGKIENDWKGESFRLLDRPEELMKGAVQEFQELLFSTGDTTLYKKITEISTEMLRYYPENTQSLMNISTISIKRNDYDRSLEALLKADRIKPGDAVLAYNIAYVYQAKGDRENAKKYYRLTIENIGDKDAELRNAAQEQLDGLTR